MIGAAVLLALLWFLFTGTVDGLEALVGLAALGLTLGASKRATGHHFAPIRMRAAWWGGIARLPLQLVVDSFAVARALFTDRFGGQQNTTRFRYGKDEAEDVTRRALAVTATSLPPNSIVVELDAERDRAIYHELTPAETPSSLQKLRQR